MPEHTVPLDTPRQVTRQADSVPGEMEEVATVQLVTVMALPLIVMPTDRILTVSVAASTIGWDTATCETNKERLGTILGVPLRATVRFFRIC